MDSVHSKASHARQRQHTTHGSEQLRRNSCRARESRASYWLAGFDPCGYEVVVPELISQQQAANTMALASWMKRAVRHAKSHFDTWTNMAMATVHVPEVLVLYRFDKPAEVDEWHVTTDSVVGGYSTAELQAVVDNGKPCGTSLCSVPCHNDCVQRMMCVPLWCPLLCAARFTGHTSLKTSGEMVRSGFATFRSLVRRVVKWWRPNTPAAR